MQVDSNYTHKYFTIYSGYRPVTELIPENFSVELSQPILDVKEIKLDYCQFANNIAPLEGLTFSWRENSYADPDPITTFNFPGYFLTPADIMTYIQNQMNTLSPNGYTYTVTLDTTGGYITWTSTGLFTIYLGLQTNSGYNLGMGLVADGRIIYSPAPAFYTPLELSYTSVWPIFNRSWGIAINVRPWSSDTCSNDGYLDNQQFVIPLSDSNYGQIVEYNHLNTFKQNISFFLPGNSFKRLFISITRWVDTLRHLEPTIKLNGEILMRFSYSTYRDTQALSESINLIA